MKQTNYFSIVRATLLALLALLLVPKQVSANITYSFNWYAQGAYNRAQDASSADYGTITMSNDDYPAISGAKVGDLMSGRYSNSASLNISGLAFVFNNEGVANADDPDHAGWYLRHSGNNSWRGLYSGHSGDRLAIRGLRAGDRIRIGFGSGGALKYIQSVHCVQSVQNNSGDLYNNNQYWIASDVDIQITSDGDFIFENTAYTYITAIIVYNDEAKYKLTDNGNNSTTFEFTANGRFDDTDIAVPYMSMSFGNANVYNPQTGDVTSDYIYVNNLRSEIYGFDGTENLHTDASTGYKPYAGNVYTFKPTAKGHLDVTGQITFRTGESQYAAVRVFKWDNANNGWVWDGNNAYISTWWGPNDNATISFDVDYGYTYYICENNVEGNVHGAFHMNKFTFTPSFYLGELGKIVDLENDVTGGSIQLTKVTGAINGSVTVKKCSSNINPTSITGSINQFGYLTITEPSFNDATKDQAGTAILTFVSPSNGEATFVVTFPYHADYGWNEAEGRSHGHIWNFVNPKLSDSKIGNSYVRNASQTGWDRLPESETTGILSIGQFKDRNSQFYTEWNKREWLKDYTIVGSKGGTHDTHYNNVYDMEGDNADMIWETEGLWFDTSSNLSCIYNEIDEPDASWGDDVCDPTAHKDLPYDIDRYVGLLPATEDGQVSSFTIPGLKDGDRVLIYMKSGEASGANRECIFLNIEGAGDAVGTPIISDRNDPDYQLYGAGGTEYIFHTNATYAKYEGCYHFVKIGDGDMKFSMERGQICKLMYIRIYKGKRIDTNHVERGGNSPLLFLNDEGTDQANAAGGWYNLHYLGKGEKLAGEVLVYSGNLNPNSFTSDKYGVNTNKSAVSFKSTVGEFGVFRLRIKDMDFVHDGTGSTNNIPGQGYKYVCDFADRNFTVGYREKMSYPYTWDFADMMGYSSQKIANENSKYPETTKPYERKGWDISLWDENGYMRIGNEEDGNNDGDIFSQNKNGFGNQLYAEDVIIPETQGLWFYMDDNQSKYNRCMQITSSGLHFINQNLSDGSHDPWWNYKVVVPSVPADGAVYLRMKRDSRVNDTDYKAGNEGNVLFLNTRFAWGTQGKTNLSEPNTPYKTQENGASYSFFQVDGTTDEYIVAVKNTTGDVNHLTFTLNGWTLEKLAVSTDAKTIGSTGFATESRDHAIDHTLTGYLSGLPVKGYIVTGLGATLDDDNRAIVVEEAGVLPAGQGCFLANDMTAEYDASADKSVKTLNDCTYLFAPDMHDSPKTVTSNLMVAKIEGGYIPAEENGKTNYALSNKHFSPSNPEGTTVYGKVGFFRITQSGIQNAHENSAYLQIPTSTANGVKAFYIALEGAEDPLAEDFGNQDITAVKGIENAAGIEGDWYNMNGQKLNGRPNASGIYVVNGKKVVIK